MTAAGPPGDPSAEAPQGMACGALIEALWAQGARQFDPVGLRFIEALARRAAALPDGIRHLLDRRLARALAEFTERFERAKQEAGDAVARAGTRFPQAAEALRQHHDSGDFRGLHRLLAQLEAQQTTTPLAELLTLAGPRRELKSLQYFRRTWSKLSVARQLSHALAQAPDNAGPLNSHHLVLQSLEQMRDLSPAYLEQFMSYVDALLWLEQADTGRGTMAGKGARNGTGKGVGKGTVKGVARGERGRG